MSDLNQGELPEEIEHPRPFNFDEDSLVSNYGREYFDLDDKGYYLKPETQSEVLFKFPNGDLARKDFVEIGDKVYLRISLANPSAN